MTQTILLPQSSIPGPAATPLIGYRGNIIKFLSDPIAFMIKLQQDYGNVAAFIGGVPRGMVFAFGAKYNQQVLSDADTYLNAPITMPGPKDSANRRISMGILSMSGERHKFFRRLMTPAFHVRTIPSFQPVILQLLEDQLESWKDGGVVDVSKEMTRLMKLFSIKMLLGLEDSKQALALADLMEEWYAINIYFPTRVLLVDLPGFPYHKMLRMAETLEGKLIALMNEKRAKLSPDSQDVLSLLLNAHEESGEPISDADLVGQLNFLFAASYETTANSMSWILFLLSQHPQVMSKLMENIDEVLENRPPKYEDLDKLTYLDCVIREGLRMFAPPVYANRVLAKSVELDNYSLPERSTIVFSHYMTHRDPAVFENPDKFDPDRWLTIKPNSFEYLPFGAGAHACLGYTLSFLIMKTVLSTVLSRYRLTCMPDSDISRKVLVTLSAKNGIPMQLTKQDKQFAKSKSRIKGNVHEMVDLR